MEVMYNLVEAIRVTTLALMPFITVSPKKIFAGLGLTAPETFGDGLKHGAVADYQTGDIEILYPRLDLAKELKELEEFAKQLEEKPVEEKTTAPVEETKEEQKYITFDDFIKVELKVGEVIASCKVEKSNKLLNNTVKIGDETRTILSGIAKYYTPEEMVGKRVVVVTNLAPRKMCGIESCGMILCASEGDKLCLVSPESVIESGAEVC